MGAQNFNFAFELLRNKFFLLQSLHFSMTNF